MFEQVSLDLGGRKLTLETGKMARQAHGAITARYGDSVVLATACMDNKATEKDFLPLTVDYREYTHAAGKAFRADFSEARRAPFGARNSDLAINRPAAAAAIS